MKARKIFDGVFEFPSWKPEPIGTTNWSGGDHDMMKNDSRNNRLRHVITNARFINEYPYNFRPEYGKGERATQWHPDGPMSAHDGVQSTHVLLLIACDNRKLGTEVSDCKGPLLRYDELPPSAKTYKCKVWTPYLIGQDIVHRSAVGPWDCSRLMYRIFLKLDERDLTYYV